MMTIKKNIGVLTMNNNYKFIGIVDMGEANFDICNNCGRPIRYSCELIDQNNKHYFVGTECVKTLAGAKISNEHSMQEQIKEFKKIAEARLLLEKSDNIKIWAYNPEKYKEFFIVGSYGKQVKKISIKPVFDLFEQKSLSFVDSFIDETYKRKDIIITDWCFNDIFTYHRTLLEQNKTKQ